MTGSSSAGTVRHSRIREGYVTQQAEVSDNEGASRFEVTVEGATAFAEYQLAGRAIIFIHTEVPDAMQGRGVGSALARGALDSARERGLEVVPVCPFIAGYIKRHPEYLDLVSERNRQRLQLNT